MTAARQAILVLSLAGALCSSALAQPAPPDATLSFSGASTSAGLGFTWGDGTLAFKGKRYVFSVVGLGVVDASTTKIDGTGQVFHLKRVDDFSGRYFPVHPGEPFPEAGTVAEIKNQHGVIIRFQEAAGGAALVPAQDGVSIILK